MLVFLPFSIFKNVAQSWRKVEAEIGQIFEEESEFGFFFEAVSKTLQQESPTRSVDLLTATLASVVASNLLDFMDQFSVFPPLNLKVGYRVGHS